MPLFKRRWIDAWIIGRLRLRGSGGILRGDRLFLLRNGLQMGATVALGTPHYGELFGKLKVAEEFVESGSTFFTKIDSEFTNGS